MHIYHIKIWWFVWFCENVSQMDPLSCRFCCADRSACRTCARVVAERCVRILRPTDTHTKFRMITMILRPLHIGFPPEWALSMSSAPVQVAGFSTAWAWPHHGERDRNGTMDPLLHKVLYLQCSYIPESVPVVCSQAHINFLIHFNTHTHIYVLICIYVYV